MSAELLSGLLWIPFVFVALIAGLKDCIRGYRKGLWHALGGLAAVVLATLVSVLVSRLIAGAAAPALVAMIPMDGNGQMSITAVQALLVSAISVVLAMVLFGILMLIVTPIIGAILGKLLGKYLPATGKGLKWGGAAVGLVSALVFSLFFLCPIYGTLASAAPVVQGMMSVQQDSDSQLRQAEAYINGVSDHLLVRASAAGPVSLVYDSVSRVPIGGTSVSVVEMSNAVHEALSLIEQLQTTRDPARLAQLGERLVDLTRKTFVDQTWFYELSQELVVQIKENASEPTLEDVYVRTLLELLEMPEEEFRELAAAVLDLAKAALEKGILTAAEQGDPMTVYESGILQQMGSTLNSTPRLVQIKKLILCVMLDEMGLPYEDATALLDNYRVGQLTDPQEQLLEMEALLLPGLSRDIPPVILILRHPCLGEAALAQVQEKVSFARLMGIGWDDDELELTKKEQKALLDKVKKVAGLPFAEAAQYETGLRDFMDMAQTVAEYRN